MKKKHWLTETVLLALMAAAGLAAPKPVLEPFTLRQDFQENTLGQWASYPPVQDVGYEPSLSPTSEFGAPGGRSLMRIVRPVWPGPFRFGFIRRMDAASSASTRIGFSFLLKPARKGDRIEIGIAGGDGRQYTAFSEVAGNGWRRAEAVFPTLPEGIEIEAVYIVAAVSQGDPDTDHRFLIDDFTLQASRESRFTITTPRSVAIFPWKPLVSARIYQPGETIRIQASAGVPLKNSECVLKDQDGRPVARGAAGSFSHTVAASGPTGVWRAELRGTASDGREIRTDLRLIVRPRQAAHPRLYFDAGSRERLAARARDPRTASVWAALMKTARSSRTSGPVAHGGAIFAMLDKVHLLPTLPGYFHLLNRAASRILYNSLAAWVEGDTEARDAAKGALLDVARWELWAPPWFEAHGQHTYYPAGQLSSDVALAYDLLYHDLSESERRLVRAALAGRGIERTFREYVYDNRIMVNTSNWLGHTVGGAILAAAAIQDDEDHPELAVWLGGLLLKMEDHLAASYLDDGSYGEGISYQEFDMLTTTTALTALERVYGIDYWKRSHILKSLTFPLYTLAEPVSAGFDMGDSHSPSGYTSAPIVARSGDPVLRWYYDRFTHRSLLDFLFFPESGEARPPTALPPSRVFDRKGNVVFRSGWGADDSILLFRAGPNFNHNHADQGSFLLRALGENFAVEAGSADYYKDPYYGNFFSQAAGHNTILVDGNPASQEVADTPQFAALNAHPRLLDAVTSSFHDALGAEIAPVYRDRLERFTRRIVYVKPRYFVIHDQLAAKGGQARYDWLLHVNDRSRFSITPGRALYRAEKAAMDVRIFEPSSAEIKLHDGHLRYSVFNPASPDKVPGQPGVLAVAAGPAAAAQFLVVVAPARTPEAAATVAGALRSVSGAGCTGVAGGSDLVMFRTGAGECRYQDWVTDAAAWTSTADVLSGEIATRIARGGETLFSSDRPVSFAARVGAQSITLATVSEGEARLRIHGAAVTVPAGRHETTLRRSQ
ncbi:MAG: heparinase II/III family protein [Bryobacterales bacterium]|nr:heparinase II/III family protein [Bryobacterales bacterium]